MGSRRSTSGEGREIRAQGDRALPARLKRRWPGRRVSAGRRSARDWWRNSTAPAWPATRTRSVSVQAEATRRPRAWEVALAVQVGGEAGAGAGRNVGQHRLHHLGIAAVERAEHVEGDGTVVGGGRAGLRRGHGNLGEGDGRSRQGIVNCRQGRPPVLNRRLSVAVKTRKSKSSPDLMRRSHRPGAGPPCTDPPSADPPTAQWRGREIGVKPAASAQRDWRHLKTAGREP